MVSSSSKRRSKSGKDKESATNTEPPPPKRHTVVDVLDQRRFFSDLHQMEHYAHEFYIRRIVDPKIMDYDSFTTSGLYFHHHLVFQGLVDFVAMDRPFYPDLIKVFYSNLRISANGYLQSEVNKKRIKLKPDDWYNIAHLKYEDRKISFTDIPEDIHFDRDMALASMLRPDMQGERARIVSSINVNDRLLHYVVVHILTPRMTNFAKLLQEDILMMWLLKNNISINWPHHIMQHMLKCKASDTPLPYGVIDHPDYAI